MMKLTIQLIESKVRLSDYRNVTNLNLWGCQLDDITLLLSMPGIEVLGLSQNRVKSLGALKNCHRLKQLYLRKNLIASLEELNHLKEAKFLTLICLDDNPCSEGGGSHYRISVLRKLPQLKTLDNVEVTLQEQLVLYPHKRIYIPEADRAHPAAAEQQVGPYRRSHGAVTQRGSSVGYHVAPMLPSQGISQPRTVSVPRTTVERTRPCFPRHFEPELEPEPVPRNTLRSGSTTARTRATASACVAAATRYREREASDASSRLYPRNAEQRPSGKANQQVSSWQSETTRLTNERTSMPRQTTERTRYCFPRLPEQEPRIGGSPTARPSDRPISSEHQERQEASEANARIYPKEPVMAQGAGEPEHRRRERNANLLSGTMALVREMDAPTLEALCHAIHDHLNQLP